MIPLKQTKTICRHLVLLLIIISILIVIASGAETTTQSKTTKSSDFRNGMGWPVSSTLSVSSSTSTQSTGGSGQSTGTSDSYGGIITENQGYLQKGQLSQNLIRFDTNGQVQVQVEEGVTFNVYGKKGDIWPNSSSYKTDYVQKMPITSLKPAVMNVTPGIWIFTIDAPNQGGEFYLSATQSGTQNSQGNQQTVSQSFESSSLESASSRGPFSIITSKSESHNETTG